MIRRFQCFAFLSFLLSAPAHAFLCPDGTYVSRGPCTLCPDGTYVGGGGSCVLAPDGNYVRGNPYSIRKPLNPSRPQLTPRGGYVEGFLSETVCITNRSKLNLSRVCTGDGTKTGSSRWRPPSKTARQRGCGGVGTRTGSSSLSAR